MNLISCRGFKITKAFHYTLSIGYMLELYILAKT